MSVLLSFIQRYLRLTVTRLGEQKVSLLGCTQVRNTITSVEQSRTLVSRELCIRTDGQALVVAKVRVVVEDELPATLLVDVLSGSGADVVGDDIDVLGVVTNELLKDSADDGLHARGQDNRGDVVLDGPLQVVVETRVECDVF